MSENPSPHPGGSPVNETGALEPAGRAEGAVAGLPEQLSTLRRRVDDLEARIKRPFYKDRSFWIGITTIPVIFASGWLIKLTTDRPFLLREIHRLLGTEPALIAALDEKHNALKEAIESLSKDRIPFLTAIFRVGLLQERAEPAPQI